jgi:hypothetical protein
MIAELSGLKCNADLAYLDRVQLVALDYTGIYRTA